MSQAADNQPYSLLAGLDAEQARRVIAHGVKEKIACGGLLFPLGAEADRLFLIESGRISLLMPLCVRGEERDVFLEEEGRGQMVGWSALVPPHRFTLKARAAVDAEVIALPRAALEALFREDAAIASAVHRNLATMVGQRLQKVQAMWIREIQRGIDSRFGTR